MATFLHGLDVSNCGMKIINFGSATSLQSLKVADNVLTSFVIASLKNAVSGRYAALAETYPNSC